MQSGSVRPRIGHHYARFIRNLPERLFARALRTRPSFPFRTTDRRLVRLSIKPPRSQCFDQTRPTFGRRPGAHAVSDAPVPKYAAVTQSHLWPAEKPSTDRFLRKGDGARVTSGERFKSSRGSHARSESAAGTTKGGSETAIAPPRANAFGRRDNPPDTQFRKFYERGDLPVAVMSASKNLSLIHI